MGKPQDENPQKPERTGDPAKGTEKVGQRDVQPPLPEQEGAPNAPWTASDPSPMPDPEEGPVERATHEREVRQDNPPFEADDRQRMGSRT